MQQIVGVLLLSFFFAGGALRAGSADAQGVPRAQARHLHRRRLRLLREPRNAAPAVQAAAEPAPAASAAAARQRR